MRSKTPYVRSTGGGVVPGGCDWGISVRFAGASASDQLEHNLVRQASCIVGGVFSSVASLYSTRLRSRARKIIGNPTHPAYCLFEPLPSFRQTF